MTEREVAVYYYNLPKWDKGRFTSYICKPLGGTSRSWQAKLLTIYRGKPHRPLSPSDLDRLTLIIEDETWKLKSPVL